MLPGDCEEWALSLLPCCGCSSCQTGTGSFTSLAPVAATSVLWLSKYLLDTEWMTKQLWLANSIFSIKSDWEKSDRLRFVFVLRQNVKIMLTLENFHGASKIPLCSSPLNPMV